MEGTPFGRYRLLGLVGRGGMGEVWRAHDTETNRTVALKLLPESLVDDPVFVERFRREAHAVAALNDPHVVPIHHYGDIDGRLYVDMRFVEGKDLLAVISGLPMAPRRAVAIVEQIAGALDAAHRVGIVHRDVKPSNILVGERDFAYLIDFGIARAEGDSSLTTAGSALGTWAYMAPERFDNSDTSASGDIYALACVLYESLTGQQPFKATSPQQLMSAHLNVPPPRPTERVRDLAPGLDAVVATGMAKNPAQRFASPGDLARAARAAIEVPATAVNMLIRQPLPPPPPTRPASLYQPPAMEYRQPVERVSPPSRRTTRKLWAVVGVGLVVAIAIPVAVAMSSSDPGPEASPSTTTAMTSLSSEREPKWAFSFAHVDSNRSIRSMDDPSEYLTASGEFLVVGINVTNNATEAKAWSTMSNSILNGTVFSNDRANRYLNGYATLVQPGETRILDIAFDVPPGTSADSIRLFYGVDAGSTDIRIS